MRFRAAITLFGLLLGLTARAQTPPASGQTLFDTVRPDVIVTIKKHQTGADLVEIACERDGYPSELLRSQVANLGSRLGVAPRGLKINIQQIPTGGVTMSFLRCSFGINGILDNVNGRIALQPIAQAFAGAHENFTIRGISILIDGESPTARDVRRYRSEAADVDGLRINDPPGLEYRILLKTTEPEQIFIPSWSGEQPPAHPVPPPPPKSDTTLIVLIIVAALAVGALVYSFLLRNPTKRPSSPSKN